MATEKFSNSAASTLNGAINGAVTSLVVTSAASFPSSGQFRILIGTELMLVTGVSGTTFTVTRGVESTTAASHSNGDAVTHVLTAAALAQTIADAAPTISYGFAACTNNTNTNSASWTDVAGCSLSLTAGTWFVAATAVVSNLGSNSTVALKLYYGSTNLIAVEDSVVSGFNTNMALSTVVVLGSTQSVILAGRQQTTQNFTVLRYGDPNTGAASISGTQIMAIKLAA